MNRAIDLHGDVSARERGTVPAVAGLALMAAATVCIPLVAMAGMAHGFLAGAALWRPAPRRRRR